MASVKAMSIVKINAITVPEGAGEELERRFSANSSKMTDVPGFIGFQLLRPTAGESRYFVFTEWKCSTRLGLERRAVMCGAFLRTLISNVRAI